MEDFIPLVAVHEDQPQSDKHTPTGTLKVRGYSSIVFLYPSLAMAILGGVLTGIGPKTPGEPGSIGLIFSLFFVANLAVMTFRFTKKSTTLCGVLFIGLMILSSVSTFVEDMITGVLSQGLFMNTTFYWMWFFFISCLIMGSVCWSRLEYWTVGDGELKRHRFLRTVGTWPLTDVAYHSDEGDLAKYILLRSGRLVIHPNTQDGPIIIDHVPRMRTVTTRLEEESLGALCLKAKSTESQDVSSGGTDSPSTPSSILGESEDA